ncbi:MAG: helix-turn-helix domain-containing protein [Polyangiaceae bacterium]|nr:helix-turn-helix domain-containing protein [Polyangiaceae bacterium]
MKNEARKTPLARKLQELRECSGFSVPETAAMLKCSSATLLDYETGRLPPPPAMRKKLADVLDIDEDELERLAALNERPASCDNGCLHDGEMLPGGLPADVYDDCVHYADCLRQLTRAYPRAKSAHCPQQCAKRDAMPFLLCGSCGSRQHWGPTLERCRCAWRYAASTAPPLPYVSEHWTTHASALRLLL